MNGLFITFEGGEGTGKSTQIEILHTYLSSLNFDVVVTKEPGATEVGDKIKNILLKDESVKLDALTELFLYLADRAHHVHTVIKPALVSGKIIICDRYIDSTLAYQGYGRKLKLEEIEYLNRIATSNLLPDITFLLDTDPVIGRKRIRYKRKSEPDKMELEKLKFHRLIRQGYLELANKFNDRIKVINAELSIDEIHNIIKIYLNPFLNKLKEQILLKK